MQATNIIIKSVALFIILLLIGTILIPGFFVPARGWLYSTLIKAANVYLSFQTRDLQSLEGKHFVVKYSSRDEDTALFILNTAEKYYSNVKGDLNYQPGMGSKILIVIYPDDAALNKSFGWAGDKSAVGVYWAGSIRLLSPHAWLPNTLDINEMETAFQETGPLSHELTHFLVDQETKGNYTRWFTEGLAQYVEEQITGFTLDQPAPAEKKQLYSLQELNSGFDKQPDQALAYWESKQAVSFLIDHFGMDKMQDLLTALGNGNSFSAALEKVYGLTESSLDQYLVKVSQNG